MKKKSKNKRHQKPEKPRFTGWISTDEDEIKRRKYRAMEEKITVNAVNKKDDFYGVFSALSISGRSYDVEIRSLIHHHNSCNCPDFLVNGLGTCKHIEATLIKLEKGRKRRFKLAAEHGSPQIEIFLDQQDEKIKVLWPRGIKTLTKKSLLPFFDGNDALKGQPLSALPKLMKNIQQASQHFKKRLHFSGQIEPWLDELKHRRSLQIKRKSYEKTLNAANGKVKDLKLPLLTYQQYGMLHLAFTGRALLADEMGLGKTVQAIAACAVLKRIYGIKRILVVAPASLKSEWEEQIAKFTHFSSKIIIGTRKQRLKAYANPCFFNLVNYEQIRPDVNELNTLLKPDIIILDEAQRIKNWQTKTAESVKQLKSPFAFVLTGTPLENRIDEVYSLVQFLNPRIFGPLFRFNRDFHQLNDKGRVIGYKNLDMLNARLKPIMLRRKKEDVEGELPSRSDKNYFVSMNKEQSLRYNEYSEYVSRLAHQGKHRALTKEEMEKMQRWLACMRMLCDTPYILDQSNKTSPKIKELSRIIPEIFSDGDHKVLIFSEWERMLVLVKEYLEKKHFRFAWHTGSTSQPKRREQINQFKKDPECRFFLSTDSGSLGLNLQAADVVINLDLPWNPAKLEQRIARAWRKHQTRPVQVINLICQHSIEHKILGLLKQKSLLAQHVIDGKGELTEMNLPSGREAFLKRVDDLLENQTATTTQQSPLPEKQPNLLEESTDLVEFYASEGAGTALVVTQSTDKNANENIKQEINKKIGSDDINVEIIDKATYETIQRLINAGILMPTSKAPASLHKNPAIQGMYRDQCKQRLTKTKKQLGAAEHKYNMAKLLYQGGFASEALNPLLSSMEVSIRSLFYFSEGSKKHEFTAADIKSKLENKNLAPSGTSDLYSRVKAACEENKIDEHEALFEQCKMHLLNIASCLEEHIEMR